MYKIDLTGATDITGVTALTTANLGSITLVQKHEFLNVLASLNANGITADNIPAKLEGVAFGPDLVIKGVNKHTLFIANDNDFLPSVGGINNPNQFFVFSIDESDLNSFGPQQIVQSTHNDD